MGAAGSRPSVTVTAAAPPPPPQPGPTVGFSPIYYPGVADIAGATKITLATGEERAGLDFQLQTRPDRKRVEGDVIDPTGRPASRQLNHDRGRAAVGAVPQLGLQSEFGNVDQATGKFTFRGVTPGRYTIFARSTVRPANQSPVQVPVAPVAPVASCSRGRPGRFQPTPPPPPRRRWCCGRWARSMSAAATSRISRSRSSPA